MISTKDGDLYLHDEIQSITQFLLVRVVEGKGKGLGRKELSFLPPIVLRRRRQMRYTWHMVSKIVILEEEGDSFGIMRSVVKSMWGAP